MLARKNRRMIIKGLKTPAQSAQESRKKRVRSKVQWKERGGGGGGG